MTINFRLVYIIIAYLISIAVIISAALFGWRWLQEYKEFKVLEILASREAELGVPVYAQFTVSQSFVIEKKTEITKIVIPMYLSDLSKKIVIRLSQDGKGLLGWQQKEPAGREGEGEIHEIELKMEPIQEMVGKYEVLLDGGGISHKSKDLAPRVFVEKDGSKYPSGEFKIAGREKVGDMSLAVYGRERQSEWLYHKWQTNKADTFEWVAKWALATLLVAATPHLFYWRSNKGEATLS